MFIQIKGLLVILLIGILFGCAAITPKYILPIETTKGSYTDYAIAFTN